MYDYTRPASLCCIQRSMVSSLVVVGVGNPHAGYIMQQAFRAASRHSDGTSSNNRCLANKTSKQLLGLL